MQYLQNKGVDLVYKVPGLVRILDKFARYLYEMNIDEQEFQPPGTQDLMSFCLAIQPINSLEQFQISLKSPYIQVTTT